MAKCLHCAISEAIFTHAKEIGRDQPCVHGVLTAIQAVLGGLMVEARPAQRGFMIASIVRGVRERVELLEVGESVH